MKKLFLVLSTVCMVLCMTVTTFAYQVGPYDVVSPTSIYEAHKDEYPYGVVTLEGDSVWLYLSKGEYQYLSKSEFVQSTKAGYRSWKYNPDEGVWVTSGTGSNVSTIMYDVYVSSHDINTDNGGLHKTGYLDFFSAPPPLAEVIQGVTEEAMTDSLPALGGTMTILAVCGVGCLALLVVLKLFGKRSLIFRS